MAKETTSEESWNRYPEARVRMRVGGLETLLEGLGEDGYCFTDKPRIHFLDDGIYVEIPMNVGKHGNIVSLPLEIFIPVAVPEPIQKKVSKKKAAAIAAVVAKSFEVAAPVKVKDTTLLEE